MRFQARFFAIVFALAMVAFVPNTSLAQDNQDAEAQSIPPPARVPQPQGGVATVIGVDQPDNCLRIRSGPGNSYEVIGCAEMGQQLNITGVWTSNDWAQLADNGWVYGPQIQTDLRPPQAALSEPQQTVVVQDVPPFYYNTYDFGYLPDYGYSTYWYGGIPIIVYAANVWWRHHPWWWHKNWVHHNKGWHGGRNVQSNMRPGGRYLNPGATPRSFNATATPRRFNTVNPSNIPRNFSATNRSGLTSPNAARFNTNAFRSGTANVTRPTRSFSSPNTLRTFSNPSTSRTFSSPNTLRTFSNPSTSRTFSNPSAFRMGNVGARQFSGAVGRGFSGGGRAVGGAVGRGFGGGGGRHR